MSTKQPNFRIITIDEADSIDKYEILKCDDTYYLVVDHVDQLLYLHVYSSLEETLNNKKAASPPGIPYILHYDEFFSLDAKIEIME